MEQNYHRHVVGVRLEPVAEILQSAFEVRTEDEVEDGVGTLSEDDEGIEGNDGNDGNDALAHKDPGTTDQYWSNGKPSSDLT